MKEKIEFVKMVAAGNDFLIIDNRKNILSNKQMVDFAKDFCDRKFGVGADGVLVLENSKVAQAKMRIFNSDGSQAEMCGNGARCFALYLTRLTGHSHKKSVEVNFETLAGIIYAQVVSDVVKVKLTTPSGIKLDIPINIEGKELKVNFVNTGVPHAVVFVEGLKKIQIVELARKIRYHEFFAPKGTNVNFVEAVSDNTINVRTYERGVEDETLACGTGSVASSLMYVLKTNSKIKKIKVYPTSGELLTIYLDRNNSEFDNVWLEGKIKTVFNGIVDLR